MNTIQALPDKSDYDYWDYLNYNIDGYWLDEKLELLYPGNMYKGMIPTLVYWMERKDEKAVVWKRILPEEQDTAICPILMCPDDNDFSCTLIVAEVKNNGDTVEWSRLGLNRSKEWDAEKVGSAVDWFEDIDALCFDKEDYLTLIQQFKDRMTSDESEMNNDPLLP